MYHCFWKHPYESSQNVGKYTSPHGWYGCVFVPVDLSTTEKNKLGRKSWDLAAWKPLMTLVSHEKGLVLEGSRRICLMWLEKMTKIFSQMVVEMVIDHGRIRKQMPTKTNTSWNILHPVWQNYSPWKSHGFLFVHLTNMKSRLFLGFLGGIPLLAAAVHLIVEHVEGLSVDFLCCDYPTALNIPNVSKNFGGGRLGCP